MAIQEQKAIAFALVGCGLIGNKRAAALPVGSLVAVCDALPERAAALAAKAGAQCVPTDFRGVLASDAHAVIIATPNNNLAPLALECIRAGKHVLVEKPGGTSVQQIDELIYYAKARSVLVRTGFNHRYHLALQRAHQLFESGALGPLMFLRGRYGHGGRIGYEREWRADPVISGGGELIDQGVHLIDLAAWFLGSWTSVEGHAVTYYWDMPVDDNAFLQLRNALGNTAFLHVSCTEWKNLFSLEIYGKHAKLHVEGLGGSYGTERLYYYKMLPELGPPETIIHEFPRPDRSWESETLEFIEDIRCFREPVPGLREARAALEVVEKVYQSSGFRWTKVTHAG